MIFLRIFAGRIKTITCMKKFYIIALCGCVGVSALAAGFRFKSIRKAPAEARKLAFKAEEKQPLWRPVSDTEYLYQDGEWLPVASNEYEYDSRGNAVKAITDEGGELSQTVTEYDEFGKPLSIVAYFDENGDGEWVNYSKRTYTYDPLVHDFYTERMGYDWNGNDWVRNYYCELNTVTRNADGNITEIEKSLPMGDDFIPAYKAMWNYDESTGRANEFYYYANNAGTALPKWTLYDNLSYKNVVWENTNGQMTTDSFTDLVSGDNRVASADVYYEDEMDGHYFVTYNPDCPEDYSARATYADPAVVGATIVREQVDDNGSYTLTKSEYFDEEGEPTSEPTYTLLEEVTYDDHGNIILDEMFETMDGFTEQVDGVKVGYTYDNDGNVKEMVINIYDYEGEEYVPDSKTVYGEYVDASAGIDNVAVDSVQGGLTVFNLQGMLVKRCATAEGLKSLPAGIYIINGRKQLINH